LNVHIVTIGKRFPTPITGFNQKIEIKIKKEILVDNLINILV
jgi:hypothetical protein